eukprot:m.47062 g.47062  ORF g.47062 m.47062 type:complete len:451 (-) comp7308_c1_seq2:120-1472(-)
MDLPTSLETRSWKRESCFVQFSKHGVIQVDFLHTHNQTWLKSYKHEVTTSLKEELLKQTQDGTFGLMEAPTFEFETQNICCKCSLKQVKSKGYVNVHTFRNGSSMITTKGGAVLAYQFARTHPLRIVISCYSRIDQNEKGSCKMENKHKRKVSEYFCCTNVNDNNIEEKEVVAAMTTTILKSHLTIKTNSNSEGEQRDDCEDNVIHCKKSRSSSVDNENDDNDIPSILEDRKHPLEKTTASKPHSSSASLLLSSSSSSFSQPRRSTLLSSSSSTQTLVKTRDMNKPCNTVFVPVEKVHPSPMHYHSFEQGVEEEYSRAMSKEWMKRVAYEKKSREYGAHIFGSKHEKFQHRAELREGLLQQIEEKRLRERRKQCATDPLVVEMLMRSRQEEEKERKRFTERQVKMRGFAEYNQRRMDSAKSQVQEQRQQEKQQERSLWSVDPINWSRTLT